MKNRYRVRHRKVRFCLTELVVVLLTLCLALVAVYATDRAAYVVAGHACSTLLWHAVACTVLLMAFLWFWDILLPVGNGKKDNVTESRERKRRLTRHIHISHRTYIDNKGEIGQLSMGKHATHTHHEQRR